MLPNLIFALSQSDAIDQITDLIPGLMIASFIMGLTIGVTGTILTFYFSKKFRTFIKNDSNTVKTDSAISEPISR